MPDLSNLHIKGIKVLISQISNKLQAYTTALGLFCFAWKQYMTRRKKANTGLFPICSHKYPESHRSDIAKDDLFEMKVWTGI